MKWAALTTWLLTAGGGFVLLGVWVRAGGLKPSAERPRIRPPLILGHFALAVTGLVLWIVYLASDTDALAWVAFVLLLVVALLGFTMFGVWLQRRRGRGGSIATAGEPAEQGFPVPVVALHGLLAATTLVLVLLAAAGVG
jgi:manganese efflux pump family protein